MDKKIQELLYDTIYNCYTKFQLTRLYKRFSGKKMAANTNKKYYTQWFFDVVTNKKKLRSMLDEFNEAEYDALERIVFKGEAISYDEIRLESEYLFNSFYYNQKTMLDQLKDKFVFFYFAHSDINLPPLIKKLVLECIEIPDSCNLQDLSEPGDTAFSFDNENFILKHIKKYIKFLGFSSLTGLEKVNKKILKRDIKDFKKYCQYNELIPVMKTDKEIELILKFLQGHIDATFDFEGNYDYNTTEVSSPDVMKNIFYNFFYVINDGMSDNFLEKKIILDYLSLNTNYSFETVHPYRDELLKMLLLLSDKNWVAFDNLLDSLEVNGITLNPDGFSDYNFRYHVSFKNIRQRYDNYRYFSEGNISKNKNTLINTPLFKGYFQILALFGIIEARYDNPIVLRTQDEWQGIEYFTLFDELKYIRLTDLGKYVIGKKLKYDYEESEESDLKISFSPDVLIATVDINNNLAKIVLREFGEQVGANSFKFNYGYFFKNSKSEEELEDKLNRLDSLFDISKLPPNWQEFFNNLKHRFIVLNPPARVSVFTLPPDKELIRLFITNKKLQRLILKVEKNKFAVHSSNITKLKKIVAEHGFWLKIRYLQEYDDEDGGFDELDELEDF